MVEQGADRWPTEFRLLKGRSELKVSFDDGLEATVPAELLRVFSPSAEVQGHANAPQMMRSDKSGVRIEAIERVGSYALRLLFSDGHSSGFYTWPFFEDFALTLDAKRAAYAAALAEIQSNDTAK